MNIRWDEDPNTEHPRTQRLWETKGGRPRLIGWVAYEPDNGGTWVASQLVGDKIEELIRDSDVGRCGARLLKVATRGDP